MTKHRSREERIGEILRAATDEIIENGYTNLTIDAVALRCGLSKGSIYRFYKNKRDIALALFTLIYEDYESIDYDAIYKKNLSPSESLLEAIMHAHFRDEKSLVYEKLWLQMLPETVNDDEFRKVKQVHLENIKQQTMTALQKILFRDGLQLTPEAEEDVNRIFSASNMLFEGMIIEELSGTPFEDLKEQARWYLEMILMKSIESVPGYSK